MLQELTECLATLRGRTEGLTELAESLNQYLREVFLVRERILPLTSANPEQFVEDLVHTFVNNFFISLENRCEYEALMQLLWFLDICTNHDFKREFFAELFGSIQNYMAESDHSEIKEALCKFLSIVINRLDDLIKISKNIFSEKELTEDQKEFLLLLMSGEVKQCIHFLLNKIKEKRNVSDILDYYISPTMEHIGYLWQTGKLTIPEEHLITSKLLKVLTELRKKVNIEGSKKGRKNIRIVILLPPGERHQIGAIATCDLLEILGYDVHYFGYNYEIQKLINFLKRKKINIICISITLPAYLTEAKELIKIIRANTNHPLKIIIGSRLCAGDPELHQKLLADYCCKTISEFIKTINYISEESYETAIPRVAIRS